MSNDDRDPVLATLEAAEQFLRQQQDVHGNIIYRSHAREQAAAVSYAAPLDDSAGTPGTVNDPPVKSPVTRRPESVHGVSHASSSIVRTAPQEQSAQTPAPTHSASPPRTAPTPAPHAQTAQASGGRPIAQRVHEAWEDTATLAELNDAICTCQKCPLGATRTKFVFGIGNPASGVMVIGEAPGADEDAKGEPFVGRAGQLLNKILEAVRFAREDVFIANILKCRPPNNRRPAPSEVELCEPYLWKQIEMVKPKIILCLGLTAAQTLLRSTASLGTLRGTVQTYRGIPLIVTYHPAALLRNPNWKRPTWEDVQQFRKLYDDIIAAG